MFPFDDVIMQENVYPTLTVHNMAADYLATQGARPSAAMALAYFFQNIPVSVSKGLDFKFLTFNVFLVYCPHKGHFYLSKPELNQDSVRNVYAFFRTCGYAPVLFI